MDQIIEYSKKRDIFARIESIMTASRRAADIVENMLSFSRKSESRFQECRLSDIIEKTINMAQNDYDLKTGFDFKKINIIREFAPETPCVKCDPNKIQQVFFNLLKNGLHAMTSKGKKDEKRDFQFIIREFKTNESVAIEIEDNGPGMDIATKKRIFEPFFSIWIH